MVIQPVARQVVLRDPQATFVNCVYTVQITQQFRQLGVTLTAVFPRAARGPAHNNGCYPLS